jgi:hypothetical protein
VYPIDNEDGVPRSQDHLSKELSVVREEVNGDFTALHDEHLLEIAYGALYRGMVMRGFFEPSVMGQQAKLK